MEIFMKKTLALAVTAAFIFGVPAAYAEDAATDPSAAQPKKHAPAKHAKHLKKDAKKQHHAKAPQLRNQPVANTQTYSKPTHNVAYDFAPNRSAKIANENAEYFKKVGDNGPNVKTFNKFTDSSQYPFPGARLDPKTHSYKYDRSEN